MTSQTALFAQLPTANNGLIYFYHGSTNPVYDTTIYTYNPNLPISTSNPSINTITLPAIQGHLGLAVSDNLDSTSPVVTFYTTVWDVFAQQGHYYYYNGTNWVNTGHVTGGNIANDPCGAKGFIYNNAHTTNTIYKYTGVGNDTLLLSLQYYGNNNSLIAADCANNFYLLTQNSIDTVLRKFDSTGTQVDSFRVTGPLFPSVSAITILGNRLYVAGGSYGLHSGILVNHTINLSLVSNASSFTNIKVMASYCGSALNNIIASADTVWYCQSAPPAQVYGTGPGPYTWSVLSGPATVTGSGDTVGLSCSGMAKVVLSSNFTSPCGSSTDTIVVILKPSPNVSNIISNSPLCQGDSLSLSISNPQLNMNYGWTGPNNFSSNLFSPVKHNMQFVDSGYYAVTATAVNGCSAKDSVMVQVKPKPELPAASSNSPLCAGDTLKLHATDTTSGINYSWAGPASFSSSLQNPVRINVAVADAGKYKVRATLNGCNSGYDSTDVVINPVIVPSVSISSLPAVITAGHVDTFTATTNCSNATYQWYKNGTVIPGATSNPYLTLLAAGDIITVEVHCSGCANPDTALSNSLTTVGIGTSPGLSKGEVTVWPNPVGDSLSLSLSEGEGTARMYNAIGQLVYTSAVQKGVNTIDTKHFAVGVYVLEVVYSDGGRDVVRVVKE